MLDTPGLRSVNSEQHERLRGAGACLQEWGLTSRFMLEKQL